MILLFQKNFFQARKLKKWLNLKETAKLQTFYHRTPPNSYKTTTERIKNYHRTPESHHRKHVLYHYTGIFNIMLRN